ncbi:hypothetical protein BBJ28_00017954 [Nothophytophthora sp. Chile5]|nr:hypothetical protein BBJ28_00017954 [Nothophytophthora sp. Chile5]
MASEDGWSYSLSFYVNGLLDTEVRVRDLVLANEGPLHIGKGPWTDGMQGFTSNLRVFPTPISAAEHRERYFLEKRAHDNYVSPGRERGEINNDIEASWAHSAVRHPATQISFLLQRFQTEWTSHEGGGDGPSEDSSEPGDFKKVQDAAYEGAIAAVELCTTDAWDLLVEAADLGHPAALSDTGEAYLYGSYALPDHCASLSHAFSVEQNLTHAKELLERAFKGGVMNAGKPLALLLGMGDKREHPEDANLSQFTTGLFHLSAASGRKEAFAILGRNYRQDSTTSRTSTEVAAYHYHHAAVEASVAFHERGKQPFHEMTRLYDSLERDVTIGERGDDDELIQFQKMRADKEGNVAAMAAMGDLYYWGAHGVTRDHAQAYHYFERAAQAGNTESQSAVAGMLLKGEGAAQDNATAIEWYEKAAEKNHTRALNGLGFIHFHGSGGVSENKSLALEYFERAAANEEDGDSVFNAGYCHATGLGTAVNVTRAMQFYDVAVNKFGHFAAIFEMGKIYMEGVSGVVPRDSGRALPYLKAAAGGGQWGSTMRKAFDLYVNGEFERAVVLYHEARALEYPVATSNLAFIYDQKLLRSGDEASERQGLKYLYLACEENGDREVLVRIGDYHYYGLAGLRKDPIAALRWYSRASAEGVDVGAYNVGHMYEYGDGVKANLARAERYYNRVLELSSDSTEIYLVVRFALARLSLRKWLHHTPLEALLGFQSPMTATADANESRIDSVLAFGATKTFSGNYYLILTSTLAILVVGIAVKHFQRTR